MTRTTWHAAPPMALLIAVAGITLTLLLLARERVSELALYRALGASRRAIFRVFVGEGVGMAALGVLVGVPGAPPSPRS